MSFLEILQLDTRPGSRDEVFATLRKSLVFGAEVTDPELAAACAAGNIDPQHLGGRGDLSAIEVVYRLLKGDASAATVRPDLDSLGSMAVLDIAMDVIQAARALEGEILERVRLIGEADRFERGGWPGTRPFPTATTPWFEAGGASETRALAAMAAVVQDRTLELPKRVALLKRWLTTGEEPVVYRERVEAERLDMIAALERGDIAIGGCDRVATIVSTHRAALGIGYHCAPVVVALNPEFRFRDGEPHAKFTVAQFTGEYVNLRAVLDELNEREAAARGIPLQEFVNRWGGSPKIGGSPQGESSLLSMEDVIEVVTRHLSERAQEA